jgi:hypothetical protein
MQSPALPSQRVSTSQLSVSGHLTSAPKGVANFWQLARSIASLPKQSFIVYLNVAQTYGFFVGVERPAGGNAKT